MSRLVTSQNGSAIVTCLAAASLLVGCPVDTRTLEPGVGLDGEAGGGPARQTTPGNNDGGGSGSGDAAGTDPGVAGAAGMSEEGGSPLIPTIDGCADLDSNGVADCTETLVHNSTFDRDAAGWTAETDTVLSWDPQNAVENPSSGSASIAAVGVIDPASNGASLRAVSQCLPVSGARLVTVYVNAFVYPGQDPQGDAEVDVFFFNAADCAGTLAANFSTPQPLGWAPGSWITLKAGSVSGNEAQSMSIKLALAKPFRSAAFRARFDNVLVKVQAP